MTLSIIMPRRNRPFANECELRSLVCQHFPTDEYEIIVLDESTEASAPLVFRSFQDQLPIRFVHFEGWRPTPEFYMSYNGGKNLSLHLNYGIQQARGDIILIENGEMIHLGESLYAMTEPHLQHPALLYHGAVKNVLEDGARTHNWFQHPQALFERPDIWGEWMVTPRTDDLEGLIFASARQAVLRRIGGYDQDYDRGESCGDEEMARRLRRAGCDVISSPMMVAAHLDHPRQDYTADPDFYRHRMANRLRKDRGYWEPGQRHRYYRPGTEKARLRANVGVEWGTMPPWVSCWTLDETIARLGVLS